MATKTTRKALVAIQERDNSAGRLMNIYGLSEGVRVYTVNRRTSSSGLTHHLSVMVAGTDNLGNPAVFDITFHVARVLGEKLNESNGHRVIKVQGGGMDMGFHLVYSLSSVLFRDQERAGYMLKHEWL